ncbi:MAG: glycosyltransferase 87 family protein [Candidatus Latescibacterota bacterium]
METAFAGITAAGDLALHVHRLWLLLAPAFALYLGAAGYVLWRPAGSWPLILACGLVFRLTLLPSTPSLSDDIYRYIWDGRVQRLGINPYHHAPSAPELAFLRDELYDGINHKDVPTIYPPLAQVFFRAAGALGPQLRTFKVAVVLCEAALLLLLVHVLHSRGQDPRRLLLYAWNPLPVIEVAGSGHVDPLGVLLMVTALQLLAGGRAAAAGAALAAAVLAKLMPLVLLPLLCLQPAPHGRRPRWRSPSPLPAFLVVTVLGYALYAAAGPRLFSGLTVYAERWRFNDALFGPLALLVGLLSPAEDPQVAGRLVAGVALAGASVWTAARRSDPFRAALETVGICLLLSPTLHPWYLLWILPFMPLFPVPAWVLLTGLTFVAYDVLDDYSTSGRWVEHTWVRWTQYGPFFALLLAALLRQRLRGFRMP